MVHVCNTMWPIVWCTGPCHVDWEGHAILAPTCGVGVSFPTTWPIIWCADSCQDGLYRSRNEFEAWKKKSQHIPHDSLQCETWMAVSEQGQITPACRPSQARFQCSYPYHLGLGGFPELGKMSLNKWHCWNAGETMKLKIFQSQSFDTMNTICQHLPHVALTHLLPQKHQ